MGEFLEPEGFCFGVYVFFDVGGKSGTNLFFLRLISLFFRKQGLSLLIFIRFLFKIHS